MCSAIVSALRTMSGRLPLLRVVAWLLVLVSTMATTGLAAKPQKEVTVETLATVVVNGVPISEAALNREINRLAPVAEYHNLSAERWQAIRKQAIDNVVDKELFYREAINRGISWDEQWVEYTFEKNREKYANDKHTSAILEDEQVKNRLYEDLRHTYVISKLWQQGKKQSMPNQSEIKAYFQNHRDKYRTPKAVKVVELLLKMKPSASKAEWDKARKKINSIYKRVRKQSSFVAYRKGKAGVTVFKKIIHEGMRDYDIEAIEKMADGEISKPMFTLKGYVLFKKLETVPQVPFSFKEVKEQVKNDLLNKNYRRWFESLRQELRDKSKIIIGAGPGYVGR